jgi:hypothetical protein
MGESNGNRDTFFSSVHLETTLKGALKSNQTLTKKSHFD